VESIKEKRRIVSSLKEKLQKRYRMTVAEVDLLDSLLFAHIGAAIISNSKSYGEGILQKSVQFVEETVPGRLHDVSIMSEVY
jgi:uncharacterized protein YlxP (DUF503 family)